jgi:hypothetical protein
MHLIFMQNKRIMFFSNVNEGQKNAIFFEKCNYCLHYHKKTFLFILDSKVVVDFLLVNFESIMSEMSLCVGLLNH